MLGANQPLLTPVLAQLVRNSFQTQHYLCSKSLFHYSSCGEEVAGRGGERKRCPTHPSSSSLPVAVSRDVKEIHILFQGAVFVLPLNKTPLSMPQIFSYEIYSICLPYPCISSSEGLHSSLPKCTS